jgi:uncharacterized integral membrane protein
MRKFFSSLGLIVLGIALVTFAVANRHRVTVSFNPLDPSDPSLSATPPLFVLIIAVAILGVVAGGIGTWFGQRHWRRAARRHEADARQARTQLNDLRAGITAPAGFDPQRLPAPRREGAGYGATGRDKQGATL